MELNIINFDMLTSTASADTWLEMPNVQAASLGTEAIRIEGSMIAGCDAAIPRNKPIRCNEIYWKKQGIDKKRGR